MPVLYSIQLAADRAALDAYELDTLIDLYIADVARRRDPKTANGYGHKLRHFRIWWQVEGPAHDWQLTADLLIDFLRHLESVESARGGQLAYNTRRDVMRFLRQCLRWAHQRGHIQIDFSLDVPMPSGSPPARLPVELESLAAMLDAANGTGQPLRDRAIIALLAGTGVRCEECAAIQVEHVTLYAGGAGVVLLPEAKYDKRRPVAFDCATGGILAAHLATMDRSIGPLFPSRKGVGSLSPSGLYKVVAKIADAAGVRDRVTGPHDLRRMFATFWARRLPGKGYGELLQKQMGHASWETTQTHYLLTDIGDVLDVLESESISPISQLADRA